VILDRSRADGLAEQSWGRTRRDDEVVSRDTSRRSNAVMPHESPRDVDTAPVTEP